MPSSLTDTTVDRAAHGCNLDRWLGRGPLVRRRSTFLDTYVGNENHAGTELQGGSEWVI